MLRVFMLHYARNYIMLWEFYYKNFIMLIKLQYAMVIEIMLHYVNRTLH